jgi:hypothetical protein
MKNLTEFHASLTNDLPDNSFSPQLMSLWYDGKGNWQKAHAQVDHLSDKASAWVHAYLHRKEGDMANADYWYRRADQRRPAVSLQDEWTELVEHFLHG